MEKFDIMYNNLAGVYSNLEGMMSSLYEELRLDPTNEDKANLLQGLGSAALSVISSQQQFVEDYCSNDIKDVLLSNLENKALSLSNALAQERNRTR